MASQPLRKRCERCEKLFDIPKIKRNSDALILAIQYTPCPHCFYSEKPNNPKFNKSGRCVFCSIPFSMVDHKAKGACHRCLMAHYRDPNSTKQR